LFNGAIRLPEPESGKFTPLASEETDWPFVPAPEARGELPMLAEFFPVLQGETWREPLGRHGSKLSGGSVAGQVRPLGFGCDVSGHSSSFKRPIRENSRGVSGRSAAISQPAFSVEKSKRAAGDFFGISTKQVQRKRFCNFERKSGRL